METTLVKIFAVALALSQVTTTPDAVKTQFDRAWDQEQVARLLRAGCTHMRKAFDLEDTNLEELIATALDDPQAVADENKAFRGINFVDLQTAYRQFCKEEQIGAPVVDLGEVIDFYNKAAADLPDHTKLKALKLPGASVVLDRRGDMRFSAASRRRTVSCSLYWPCLSFVGGHPWRYLEHTRKRKLKHLLQSSTIRQIAGPVL